jgi:hypothetical protein
VPVANQYTPWVLSDLAPAWVATVFSEEHWPERDVAHLLKRLLAEDVDRVHLHVSVDGIATVELQSDSHEWATEETSQQFDLTRPRPFDDAIKRAIEFIARKPA